nr:hypothetical protein [Tanacetum cinerariifolium]
MVTTRNNPNDNVPNFEAIKNAAVANALPNVTAALRTQITNDIRNGAGPSGGGGGNAIPHGIHVWIERYFPTSEQQCYEREYGSICQLDRENVGEYMERFTRHFKWGLKKQVLDRIVNTDYTNVAQRSAGRNGNDRQGQGNYNQRQHRNQLTWDFNQDHASASSGQRRSTETLPPPPLCATCGKPHPGVCYKATKGCFTYGSTQHKVKDCPQGKQKQSMSTDLARLPPTTGWVYATTRGQAAKTSGTITGILCIDDRTVFALFDTGATQRLLERWSSH